MKQDQEGVQILNFDHKIALMSPTNSIYKDTYQDGVKRWYCVVHTFCLHREDGPAVEGIKEYQAWYNHNERHRIDGPAIIDFDGGTEYWVNGLRHRADGPAIDSPSIGQWWFVDDRLHREDGPAVIHPGGTIEWWYRGKIIQAFTLKEFQSYIRNKAFW